MDALKLCNVTGKGDTKKSLIVYSESMRSEAVKKASQLRESGEAAELIRDTHASDKKVYEDYAASKGAWDIIYMTEQTNI